MHEFKMKVEKYDNRVINKDYNTRLSYKLCHDKKKHNFVTTQKNYEQQYGF